MGQYIISGNRAKHKKKKYQLSMKWKIKIMLWILMETYIYRK